MPRGRLTKDEMRMNISKFKSELYFEFVDHNCDPKYLADKYLNKILDKISEYRE